MSELKEMVGSSEKVLYMGKPNKKCYIYESIFNPLLPFALLWLIVDVSFIGLPAFIGAPGGFLLIIIPFMLIHMMPVWIYLVGVLCINKRYKNTEYIVTDRAIYASGGVFTRTYNVKPFTELSQIHLHRGIFDQMFGVGDIIATSGQITSDGVSGSVTLNSISNYTNVYKLVKKLQTDVYTDVMYPNAMRPGENPGYNTKYTG